DVRRGQQVGQDHAEVRAGVPQQPGDLVGGGRGGGDQVPDVRVGVLQLGVELGEAGGERPDVAGLGVLGVQDRARGAQQADGLRRVVLGSLGEAAGRVQQRLEVGAGAAERLV